MANKSMPKTELMANEKISSLVLKFSATTFAALFFSAVYNLVDALFVSRGVGDNAMGGVSIVFPFMIIQSAIAQTVGGGAGAIVSRLLGKKENEKSGEVTLNAMAIFYTSAIIITIVGFVFMNPILSLLGATDDILPYAKEYFIIMLLGNVFSTGFSSIIRAEGRMTYALLIWLIPTVINIIFDAVFIFRLGWGVKGAAAATVMCQFTSFLMCIVFFTKFSCQKFRCARLKISVMKEIITNGLPTFVQMGSLSVMTMFMNKLISVTGGTLGVNAFSYISKIVTFALVPFNSITQATSPIIGYNFGAKNKKRVKETVKFSTTVCLIYSVIALILTQFVSKYLIMIFTKNSELIFSGANGLKIIAFALPFVPVAQIAGSYYQAIGKKRTSLFLNIMPVIFLIPCALALVNVLNINGIWWSFVCAYALAAICTLPVLLKSRVNE